MPDIPSLNVAVIEGDGIGQEIVPACVEVLNLLQSRVGGYSLNYEHLRAGAECFRDTGEDMSSAAFEAARAADAILLGAIGLPSIRHDDGTEISPHLRMRDAFKLVCGVRPIKAFPNTPMRLADERGHRIDFVIVRESTEGLFYSHGRGEVIEDREARDTMLITRDVCEELFDFSFRLAQKRKSKGSVGRVTCVDKANVFRSMAFFRKIFDERRGAFPDVDADYCYVDAQALDMVRRPWDLDVLVMENMFGDILSDLGGALVGGMGMAACAEIGTKHALFQPAHGSAPDIIGTDAANPTAILLSGAMMLEWLGETHGNEHLGRSASILEQAVWDGYDSGLMSPKEFGGPHGLKHMTDVVLELINKAEVS